MTSLKVHYDIIESAEYDLEQATEALNKFMLRAQQEYNSLFKKYNSIMLAPRAALWKKHACTRMTTTGCHSPEKPRCSTWYF